MSKYKVYFGTGETRYLWAAEKSKDALIDLLLGYINGDGTVAIEVVYPDGSYFLYTGE